MCSAKSSVGVGIVGRVVAFVLAFSFLGLTQAQAQQSISSDSERGGAAIGHYARSRALIIEALAEFELGKRLADPDMLLDSQQWRMTLDSRAEELNRVLDPKPRITRSGVRYKANSRLIREDRNLSAEDIKNYPKSDNEAKEVTAPKVHESKPAKAEIAKPVVAAKPQPAKPVELPAAAPVKKDNKQPVVEEDLEDEVILGLPAGKNVSGTVVPGEKTEGDLPPANEPAEVSSTVVKKEVNPDNSVFPLEQPEAKASESAEDLDVDKAIEAVIQEKLQNLETKQKEGGSVK